jgi:hypothetical protein
MRLKDLIREANDDIVGSIVGGWKKGRDLNFTGKPDAASPEKKKLTNKVGAVNLHIDRYQLTDLQLVMKAVLKGNINTLNTREIESAREFLTQLNNS